MSSAEVQIKLIQHLKNQISPQSSLVDEMSEILGISSDSSYRRIRGEKILSIDEVYKLCIHYKLSLDNLLKLQPNGYMFSGSFVQAETFRFEDYLTNAMQHVKYMTSFKGRKMFYLCKDFAFFHHFHFKEIAAFKYYFWMKNILHLPEFADKKFTMDIYPDEFFQLGKQSLGYYNQIDSVEIWNIETVNSTLHQIEFYHDSNIFANDEEIFTIYSAMEKLIDHLEQQATLGYKFDASDPNRTRLSAFQMYFNEIVILENSLLVLLNESKAAFLVHNVLNYLTTRDVDFCDHMFRYIQNLIKKSTLISTVSEKERSRFFKSLRNKISLRKQHLRVS